jgi:hypothetical protein
MYGLSARLGFGGGDGFLDLVAGAGAVPTTAAAALPLLAVPLPTAAGLAFVALLAGARVANKDAHAGRSPPAAWGSHEPLLADDRCCVINILVAMTLQTPQAPDQNSFKPV